MPLTAITFWLVYAFGLLGALMHPLIGVLLYVLVYHLNPDQQWWGSSVKAVGLRTSLIIAIATVIGLVLRRQRIEPTARMFPTPVMAMGFLALLALVSMTWGYGPCDRGAMQTEKLFKVFIFLLIMLRCVRRPAHYHALVVVWLIGVLFLGYQAYGDVGVMIRGRLAYGVGGPDFSDSADFSTHMVASLPLAGAMFFMSRTLWGRLFSLATGALAVNAIIMTRNRSALFGVAALLITLIWALPRGYRFRGTVGVIFALIVSLHLTDPGWWERMRTTIAYEDDPSATGRLTYWGAALRMAADYPLGIGIGNFQNTIKEYVADLGIHRSAHNTYLECLAELGFVGSLLQLAAIFGALRCLGRAVRIARHCASFTRISIWRYRARFHLGWHAVALRAGIAGYLASAIFVSRVAAEDFWLLLAFAACLQNVARYVESTEAELDEPPSATEDQASPTPSLGGGTA